MLVLSLVCLKLKIIRESQHSQRNGCVGERLHAGVGHLSFFLMSSAPLAAILHLNIFNEAQCGQSSPPVHLEFRVNAHALKKKQQQQQRKWTRYPGVCVRVTVVQWRAQGRKSESGSAAI